MSNHPKISVVMTVYNAGQFLREAIESILNQSFKDFEFIVVDNKSTDTSLEIIKSFSDPRIRVIQNQTNEGQTKALNRGIRAAQTEYIARTDADDIALPNRLDLQYEYLQANPDVAVVGSWCQDIGEDGTLKRIYKTATDPFEIKCLLSSSGDLTSWCVTHPSVMMRKEALMNVGLCNEQMSVSGYPQDYDLWMRIIRRYKIANVGECLLKYRVVEKSESRSFKDQTMEYRLNISASKIKFYMPDLSEAGLDCLVRMLEFLPQETPQSGRDVLGIFDRYFKIYMDNVPNINRLNFQASKIKLYYLPVLFKTNPLLSLGQCLRFFLRFPVLIVDVRFYRKIAKVSLRAISSDRQYNLINRKIFLHR